MLSILLDNTDVQVILRQEIIKEGKTVATIRSQSVLKMNPRMEEGTNTRE